MASSALAGKLVTLIGGSGFLGTYVAQKLLARGARLRVASRNPDKSWHLKPLANLGQLQFARGDVRNPASVAAAVAGADAVVNLVGAFDGDLDAVQGTGAGRVAALAKDGGASAFIHVSAIGANAASEVAYQRSKGEQAVAAAFPGATILRPSILFGEDDQFINMFGRLIASAPAMPVFAPDARLQPVFVDDVADAIVAVLENAALAGKTYELAGPETVTMLELNEKIAEAQDRHRAFIPLPDFLGRFIANATGWLPGAPISGDQYAMLAQGNVASGKLPGLAKLGIAAKPLSLFLDRWMVRYRRHGRFHQSEA